jgi:hypothetical protein
VIRRHVLRNSLLPTITVIATQTGYLIGGLVVVEKLFNYPGIGTLIITRRHRQGLPDARGGCPVHRHRLPRFATLVADILYTLLNPRIRLGGRNDGDLRSAVLPGGVGQRQGPPPERRRRSTSPKRFRREQLRQLLRSKTFIVGAVILLWWIVCAIFGTSSFAPYNPLGANILSGELAPSARTGSGPTTSARTSCRA